MYIFRNLRTELFKLTNLHIYTLCIMTIKIEATTNSTPKQQQQLDLKIEIIITWYIHTQHIHN